jgi:hypothetical protein
MYRFNLAFEQKSGLDHFLLVLILDQLNHIPPTQLCLFLNILAYTAAGVVAQKLFSKGLDTVWWIFSEYWKTSRKIKFLDILAYTAAGVVA